MTELWHMLLRTARQAMATYKPCHVLGDSQQGMHMRPGLQMSACMLESLEVLDGMMPSQCCRQGMLAAWRAASAGATGKAYWRRSRQVRICRPHSQGCNAPPSAQMSC